MGSLRRILAGVTGSSSSSAGGGSSSGSGSASGAQSLFQLSFDQGIEDPLLWELLVYMVLFMVAVDIILRISARAAEGDRCHVQFVARLNAELAMFGAVAISILVVDEASAKAIDHHAHVTLEWVDVFCSVSACLLIVVGIWCNMILSHSRKSFEKLLHNVVEWHVEQSGSAEQGGAIRPMTERRMIDFYVASGHVAHRFEQDFGAQPSFNFGHYVHQVVGQVIVDLIDINALSWFAVGALALIGLAVTSVGRPGELDATSILAIVTAVGWSLFACALGIDLLVAHSMAAVRRHFGSHDVRTVRRIQQEHFSRRGSLAPSITPPGGPSVQEVTADDHEVGQQTIPEESAQEGAATGAATRSVREEAQPSTRHTSRAASMIKVEVVSPPGSPRGLAAGSHCDSIQSSKSSSRGSFLATHCPHAAQMVSAVAHEVKHEAHVLREGLKHEARAVRQTLKHLDPFHSLERRLHHSKSKHLHNNRSYLLLARDVAHVARQGRASSLEEASRKSRRTDGSAGGDLSTASAGADAVFPPNVWLTRHLAQLRQLIKVVMLLACGHLSLYVLHLLHNIEAERQDAGWHAAVLLPTAMVLLFLLPHIVFSFGLFEAYSVPNGQVLDGMLSDGWQLETDLHFVAELLVSNLVKTPSIVEELRDFERRFEAADGRLWRRTLAVLRDLTLGNVTTFLSKEHVFVQRVLQIVRVPCSRERLSRLSQWVIRVRGPSKESALTVSSVLLLLGFCPLEQIESVLAEAKGDAGSGKRAKGAAEVRAALLRAINAKD